MNDTYIITIGRQLGSGGRQIGEKLAAMLGFSFYDKELIQIASKESGLGKELFEQADEKTSHGFFAGLLGLDYPPGAGIYTGSYLSNEMLFKIQSDVIRELAEKQSCVFVGRCADYVLKDHPQCLNLFINANPEDRIKRIEGIYQVPEKKARDIIEKTDKRRAGYYNYYSNKTWGAAESYHLCINSSVLGIEETADFIHRFAMESFGLE